LLLKSELFILPCKSSENIVEVNKIPYICTIKKTNTNGQSI